MCAAHPEQVPPGEMDVQDSVWSSLISSSDVSLPIINTIMNCVELAMRTNTCICYSIFCARRFSNVSDGRFERIIVTPVKHQCNQCREGEQTVVHKNNPRVGSVHKVSQARLCGHRN